MDIFLKSVPHKEFDPKAFIGDESFPQELCNFILALALAYNDFKFYTISYKNLLDSKPEGDPKRNSVWGEYEGIKLHLIRLHIGFAHELFKLIQKNKGLVEHPFLKEVVRMLDKKARESWKTLVEAALTEATPRRNPLFMIRNKIIFHYETKDLLSGYQKGFFEDQKQDACLSEGGGLESSRFYFADVAVQGYLKKELGVNADEFFSSLGETMRDVNMALHHVVIGFIQRRNFAWRIPREQK